jgi:LynF/TruF/PatF family peptide O-prenyltransferase
MLYPSLLAANPKNLQFIAEHKSAFDLEYLYPLDLFEHLVAQVDACNIECSCKIQDDKLDPARFNLTICHNRRENTQAMLDFFHRVETRVGVKLDYNPLYQFLEGVDYGKITQIMAGIDARTELSKARVKTWWAIKDYPEKLETAIALSKSDSQTLRKLLNIGDRRLVVGFHLYLSGHTEVRLYPSIDREFFENIALRAKLAEILSPPAMTLLEDCLGLSLVLKEDGDKILHYHVFPNKVNSFVDNLHHYLVTRAHAPYRDKSYFIGPTVSLSERELLAGSLKTINLYYMSQ